MTRFEDILYFVDGETSASEEMQTVILRAQTLGARVTFASVIPANKVPILGDRFGPKGLEQLVLDEEAERLEEIVSPLRSADVEIATRVLAGDPAATIVRAVVADGYQMVCKAATGRRGLRDRILGCVDMRLIRACPCPVAIAGSHRAAEGRRVTVAALDVTCPPGGKATNEDLNSRILELAVDALAAPESQLHIIHAWTLYGESVMRSPRAGVTASELEALLETQRSSRQGALEKLVADVREKLTGADAERFKPEIHLVKGDPSSVMPNELERLEADLLLMGTVSRRGVTGFLLGNTAEKILDRVRCSVAVTKPEGFVTPVPLA
jgi:universal stress protein E